MGGDAQPHVPIIKCIDRAKNGGPTPGHPPTPTPLDAPLHPVKIMNDMCFICECYKNKCQVFNLWETENNPAGDAIGSLNLSVLKILFGKYGLFPLPCVRSTGQFIRANRNMFTLILFIESRRSVDFAIKQS